jgi:hypothetical protein
MLHEKKWSLDQFEHYFWLITMSQAALGLTMGNDGNILR